MIMQKNEAIALFAMKGLYSWEDEDFFSNCLYVSKVNPGNFDSLPYTLRVFEGDVVDSDRVNKILVHFNNYGD